MGQRAAKRLDHLALPLASRVRGGASASKYRRDFRRNKVDKAPLANAPLVADIRAPRSPCGGTPFAVASSSIKASSGCRPGRTARLAGASSGRRRIRPATSWGRFQSFPAKGLTGERQRSLPVRAQIRDQPQADGNRLAGASIENPGSNGAACRAGVDVDFGTRANVPRAARRRSGRAV